MPSFDDWFEELSEAQQAVVKKNLTKPPPEPEPEKDDEPSFGMGRLKKGYADADDPGSVRRERRGL